MHLEHQENDTKWKSVFWLKNRDALRNFWPSLIYFQKGIQFFPRSTSKLYPQQIKWTEKYQSIEAWHYIGSTGKKAWSQALNYDRAPCYRTFPTYSRKELFPGHKICKSKYHGLNNATSRYACLQYKQTRLKEKLSANPCTLQRDIPITSISPVVFTNKT